MFISLSFLSMLFITTVHIYLYHAKKSQMFHDQMLAKLENPDCGEYWHEGKFIGEDEMKGILEEAFDADKKAARLKYVQRNWRRFLSPREVSFSEWASNVCAALTIAMVILGVAVLVKNLI